MMTQPGVPLFEQYEFFPRRSDYCLLIPVINEGERIAAELERAQKAHVHQIVDIVLCDGGSTDGSCTQKKLQKAGVNSLLIKKGPGRQGAQLRCGIYFALQRGYEGVLTIDGNNKDSIEDVPRFLQKLKEGYDFVQGSRYVKGGKAVRTPWVRHLAVHLIHAPIISLTARHRFTDTTNAYRAYSKKYLIHPEVQPLRDVFVGYELLAYLIGFAGLRGPGDTILSQNGKNSHQNQSFQRKCRFIKGAVCQCRWAVQSLKKEKRVL